MIGKFVGRLFAATVVIAMSGQAEAAESEFNRRLDGHCRSKDGVYLNYEYPNDVMSGKATDMQASTFSIQILEASDERGLSKKYQVKLTDQQTDKTESLIMTHSGWQGVLFGPHRLTAIGSPLVLQDMHELRLNRVFKNDWYGYALFKFITEEESAVFMMPLSCNLNFDNWRDISPE